MSGIIAFAEGEYSDLLAGTRINFKFRITKPRKQSDQVFVKSIDRYLKAKENNKRRTDVGIKKPVVAFLKYDEMEIEDYIIDEIRQGMVYVRGYEKSS